MKELVKEERSELKKVYMKNKGLPNSDNANHLNQAKEEPQAAYDNEQAEYLAQKCAQIENAAVQLKAKRAWDTINEITRKTSSAIGRLKGETADVGLDKWKVHFATLLGQPMTENRNPVRKIVQDTLPITAPISSLWKNSISAFTLSPTIRHLA